MGKKGRSQKRDHTNPDRRSHEHVDPRDLDDDIDTFHKQRDIIPLDINDDDRSSSEDEEEPVFDDEDINEDEDDEDEDEDGEEDEDVDDDSEEDDSNEARFATKIKRQQKYIKEKFGTADNDINDDEENVEDQKEVWGGKKEQYYGGNKGDSSDEEERKEEEEEILRMQREKTKNMLMEDFGLQDVSEESEDERDLTLEEISKGKSKAKGSLIGEMEKMDTVEEVKKDVNSLSREEQMDVVYSSAPELVGLLSELNDALEQLESRVNPLLSKVKNGGIVLKGGIRYLEVQQLLLLAYCQAITFYLLMKSEGQPVRDHPVIARLVEIKSLLDKMKELGGSLPSEIEELLKKICEDEAVENKVSGDTEPEFVRKDYSSSNVSSKADTLEPKEPSSTNELLKSEPSRDHEKKEKKKYNPKTDQFGVQSLEMLKLRATLEEKLKQKGVFSSITSNTGRAQKHSKSVNGQLETYDDFNDDAIDNGLGNRPTSLVDSAKLSVLVSAKTNKPKVVSGDDDLPKRDDIGERRRKHELRVLAGAGFVSEEHNAGHELESNDASDMEEDGDSGNSENDFYRQVKQKRDSKLAAKTAMYSRNPAVASLPETVEGKRHINYQIEKNRGLTRSRRKDLKNPRKKYRTKHDKEKKRRLGQVQEMRKQGGSYPGEQTGINAGISRSIRF